METWPVVVVGAGAAGMSAALFATRAGARVFLLETRSRPGAKIRVSGGGRCNVLPAEVTLDDLHTSGSRHALRNILFAWPLHEVRRFFEADLGIALKQEPTGKLFPRSDRALDVVEALLGACSNAGVVLAGGWRVTSIRPVPDDGGRFEIGAVDGRRVRAARVVLATGGLSLPKTGSDGRGLEIARGLGLEVAPTYPALVPLLSSEARWTELAGLSLPARLRAVRGTELVEERERELLFTHRGFSGPVVLDMSRHVTAPDGETRIVVRWGGSRAPNWDTLLRPAGKRQVATVLAAHLPERFTRCVLDLARVARDRRACDLVRDERLRIVELLDNYTLPVAGNEGYAAAEVTGGGVALSQVHPRTLESRSIPGLHLCGEMLDAVGRIGGYNFLWAWVTGRTAGRAAGAAALSG